MDFPEKDVLDQFMFEGEYSDIQKNNCGHINHTYILTCVNGDGCKHRYLLQRINTDVFTKPYELMENIEGVTSHLANKILASGGDPKKEALTVIRTKKGELLHTDKNGGVWRAYNYIDGVTVYEQVETPEQFYNAGKALGRFQNALADYPSHLLHETIANFHDTGNRFENFVASVRRNASGRADLVKDEINFVLAREKMCRVITDYIKEGLIPVRVTHNDTKLTNILIDNSTNEAVCLIDLDTVMPGSALYDFGDSIRFGASSAAEDETDLSKVFMRMDLFESYAEGYLSEVRDVLTDTEIENLAFSAILITFECGMRFLGDYIDGDRYFHIDRPNHNLDRARTQLKLVWDMERKLPEMNRIISRISGHYWQKEEIGLSQKLDKIYK